MYVVHFKKKVLKNCCVCFDAGGPVLSRGIDELALWLPGYIYLAFFR